MTDHRFPDPVVVFVPHESGVNLCQLGHGVGHGGQAASVLGDAERGPVFSKVGAELFHVGLEHFVIGQGIPGTLPTLLPASAENGGMFPRTGVEPSPGPTDLTPELNERDIERREHQRPFRFSEERLSSGDVLGITVVRRHGNRLLLPRAILEFVGERFEHERLHHGASVAEDISAKGVDDLIAVGPSYGTVDGGFRHTVAPVVHQRFPCDLSAGWNALDLLAKR